MFNTISLFISTAFANALAFTVKNLSEALLCSGAGMVGIFLVVGIIILSVLILNKLTSKTDKK